MFRATIQSPNTLTERVIERITWSFTIVLSVLAVVLIIRVSTNQLELARDDHQNAEQLVGAAVSNYFQPIIDASLSASKDSRLRIIAAAQIGTNLGAQPTSDLISRFVNDITSVQLLDVSGRPFYEVVNANGFARVTSQEVLNRPLVGTPEKAFYDATTLDKTVVVGRFTLARYRSNQLILPSQPTLSLYVPVRNNVNQLIAIYRINLNPSNLFNVIRRAEGKLFEGLPDRRVILTSTSSVLADSGASDLRYLDQLDATRGNISTNPLYEIIAPDLRANTVEPYSTRVTGPNVISLRAIPLTNTSGTALRLFIVDNLAILYGEGFRSVFLIVVIVILVALLGALFLRRAVARLLRPIEDASVLMAEIVADPSVILSSEKLVASVAQISQKISDLGRNYEQQVDRRNLELQVMGRMGFENADQSDLDSIMRRSINLICTEMGFYHAQVFTIDAAENVARLAYSRGEVGQEMLARHHSLPIGPGSVVGAVASEQRAVIINDVTSKENDHPHRFNPMLPDTLAEMALPLIVQNELLGVLDVQSIQKDAFLPDDLPTYELLANQMAVTIVNARLRLESSRRTEEIDRLNRQLTRSAWDGLAQENQVAESYGSALADPQASVTIAVRGEAIGSLEATLPDGQAMTDSDRAILQSVADRVALAIENARLFQQTQLSLAETSTLYGLSQQLNEATSLEDIVRAVVRTVAPDASDGQLWLFDNTTPALPRARLVADVPLNVRLVSLEEYFGVPLAMPAFLRMLNGAEATYIQNVSESLTIDSVFHTLLSAISTVSLIVIPLNMRGDWKGFVTLHFDHVRPLGERERRLFDALIAQAGVAMDNRLLLQETEEALSRNEKLYRASRMINTSRSMTDLVDAAVVAAADPQLDFWLGLTEGHAVSGVWQDQVRIVARSDDEVAATANQVFSLVLAPDSPLRSLEPEFVKEEDLPADLKMMMMCPIVVDSNPIGIFYVVSQYDVRLSASDITVYLAIASQISVQIQNRRLLALTEAALSDTTRLYVASRAISSVQDLTTLYTTISGHLSAPFLKDAKQRSDVSITVLLARPQPTSDAPELEIEYQWSSMDSFNPAFQQHGIIATSDLPLASMIDNSDEGILVYDDLTRLPNTALRSLLSLENSLSAVVAAIRVRQSWFGALIVHVGRPEALTENYIRFVQAIADQIAVALDNQTLLAEAQFERANLTNILATLPAGVIVLDPDTLIPLQANARARELLSEVDFLQPFSSQGYQFYRTGTDDFYPDEETPIYLTRQINQATFKEDVSLHQGDERIELLINAAPIFDANQHRIGIVAAFQDITTLRALESTLQASLRETTSLYEIQRMLAETGTLDELLDTLLTQFAEEIVTDVHIIFINEVNEQLSLMRYLTNPIEDLDGLRSLLQETESIYIDDVATAKLDSQASAVLNAANIGSLIVVPLQSRTRALPFGWVILSHTQPHALAEEEVRFANSIADIASSAIDNNYLVQSTQHALQETASLYAASTTINRARNLEDLTMALETSLAGVEADIYAGFLVQNGQVITLFDGGFTDVLGNADLYQLVTEDLDSQEAIVIDDLQSAAAIGIVRHLRQMQGVAAIGIAELRVQDIPSGRLFLGYHQTHAFGTEDNRFLGTLSDSASVVLDNIMLLEQVQNTLQETSTLYQVSRSLTEAVTSDDLLEIAINHLADARTIGILALILDRPSWQLPSATAQVAGSWYPHDDLGLSKLTISEDDPLWAMLDVDIVTTYNLNSRQAAHRTALERLGCQTLAVGPLKTPTRDIGVLLILSGEVFEYSERELRVMQSMSEQASLSLESVRLLEQTERRANQLQTTAQISERVGQILDLDVLLPQVVNLIRDRFNYDHVQVFLMDTADDYAVLAASTGEVGMQMLANHHRLQKGSASVIGQVTAYNHVTVATDTADANVVHRPNPLLPNTRSELALPLVIKGRVVGALDVQSNVPNAFQEDDIQTLATLAAQLSVAIDNARLYEDVQSRANEMSFLFDVTTAATAADTMEGVLEAILQRVAETLEPDAILFFLPATITDYNRNVRRVLRAASVVGLQVALSDIPDIRLNDSESLIGMAGTTMQSQLVPIIEREVRYQNFNEHAQSAIIVPINSGADLVGLIVMESRHLNAYNHDTMTLLLTLSGSLAAVVENTLLVQELQSTNEQLREVDRLKSQFLANMSHELRTPLNSIIGFSRVMLKGIDGPLTEMQEQDLTTIYGSGNHLLNLINDILDQAKIEANEMQLKLSEFEVKPMIESVKSMSIGLMKDKSLQLIVEVAPNLPLAFADESRTRQILLNLMSNAVKFTSEGSVTLRVLQTIVDDVLMIRADVIDSGIGIAEEDMPILFEQFRQIDNSLTRTVGGTGLGLPISRALAELQGGQLLVTSEVGKGSTFSVLIPTEAMEAPVRDDDREHPESNGVGVDTAVMKMIPNPRGTQAAPRVELPPMPVKRDVLLIEDNKEMVDQFRRALQREGFEVMTADHPSYAEAMVGQLRPTMVMLDVNFANGAGWDILQNLKSRDDTSDIPIIVTTLNADRERALTIGANRFLQRPFMPDQLMQEVHAIEKEFNRQRILIIDDQPDALRLLEQVLGETGNYRVYVASTGTEGISMVARRRPDLVVLDLRMPDMDGFAVLNELRSNPETARIPVMVVTGDVNLNADEQEQLANVRVLPKAEINTEQYDRFLNEIRNELKQ